MKKLLSSILAAAMLIGGFAFSATADDTNLLTNGDFEGSEYNLTSTSWAFTTPGTWYIYAADIKEITTETAVSGTYSAKIKNATLGERVALEADKTYALSAMVKADADMALEFGLYDGTAAYPASNKIYTEDASVTTEWSEISLEYKTTSAQDYLIGFATWDGSTVYVDDVVLVEKEAEEIAPTTEPTATPEPTVAPTVNPDYLMGDMVVDGGFEAADPQALVDWAWDTSTTAWQTTGSSRTSDGVNQGAYAVELIDNGIGQMVDLEVGKCYKLTIMAKGSGELQYAVNDGNAQFPGTFGTGYAKKEAALTDDWTQISYEFTNTSLTKGLVYFWATGTTYIDSVILSEVTPEAVEATKLDVAAEEGQVKDTVGFTHTFTVPEVTAVTSLTWNISNGGEPVAVNGNIPTISGGTCVIGLIITDVPEAVVDSISATVTVK